MIDRREWLQGLLASGVTQAAQSASAEVPRIETRAGTVRGLMMDGAIACLGIPYGATTGDARRFLPPQDPAPWSGVFEATSFGARAPQSDAPGVKSAERQGEDCLVLNVYTPRADHGRRPVMVFLHGGGYGSGSGGPRYPGASLARHRDVVLVTVNHRLNVLGFLDLVAVDERFAESANVGVLDLIAALRWVRDNIEGFGGNPGNVTIFGQSGGGAKVSTLLASPAARGLFHRAIPMSGAVLRGLTREQSSELTGRLAHQLGIAMNDIASWQGLPASRLVEAMMAMGSTGTPWSTRLNFGPTIDGRALPHQLCDPAAPGESSAVPVMVGSTHDETRIFYARNRTDPAFDEAQARAQLVPTMKSDTRTADAVYAEFRAMRPGKTPAELFGLITTHYMFTRNSIIAAERFSARSGASAFLYRFDWVPTESALAPLGASHGTDVPLVLDESKLPGQTAISEPRLAMAQRMSGLWTQFARTGIPAGRSVPSWPRYEGRHRPTMVLNRECRVVQDPDSDLRVLYSLLPDFHP